MNPFIKRSLCLSLLATGIKAFSATSNVATSSSSKRKEIVKNEDVPGLKNGMDYVTLGDSDLVVSKICMGTMTFGKQNTAEEGVEQLAKAFGDYGINFLDTAESEYSDNTKNVTHKKYFSAHLTLSPQKLTVYPVPTTADTQGKTDLTVAKFMKTQKREDVILATKVSGRSERITWLPRDQPDTPACLEKKQILRSVDESLKRLETDYVDIIQLHWPDRYVPMFGMPDFDPAKYEEAPVPVGFEEQLEALQEVVRAGKVRYVGVSNETPYGVCSFVSLAKQFPELYPKIVSIQNGYSLVNRKDYECGLAEACYHHEVGFLAYSPLAGGSLTGKYKNGVPEGARFSMFPGFMDRYTKMAEPIDAYSEIAKRHGLTPAELALSWCYHNELVASTIIGATKPEQLEENLKAYDIRLTEEISDEIKKVYRKYMDPTKNM